MALGNLGMAYRHYAMMVSDPVHRDYMNHFAYFFLCQAVNSNDKIFHINAFTKMRMDILATLSIAIQKNILKLF